MTFVTQAVAVLALASSPTAIQGEGAIKYVRGNVEGLPANTLGYLQLRDDHLAAFHTPQGTIRLPYETMSYAMEQERKGPLQVMGLVRPSAVLRLEVKNEKGNSLSLVFKLSRTHAESMSTILRERTSQARKHAPQITSSRPESWLR